MASESVAPVDLETASDAELMEAARTQIVSEDRAVTCYSVVEGIVHVNGAPVLDAKGKPLRHRASCQVMCQACKKNQAEVALEIRVRFEPALGRRMYFHGIALSFEELGTRRCKECLREASHG